MCVVFFFLSLAFTKNFLSSSGFKFTHSKKPIHFISFLVPYLIPIP